MKTNTFLSLCFFMFCCLLKTSCGDLSSDDGLKVDEKEKLAKFGDKKGKDLTEEEKKDTVSIIVNYLERNAASLLQSMCKVASLYSEHCAKIRSACEKINKDEIIKQIKTPEEREQLGSAIDDLPINKIVDCTDSLAKASKTVSNVSCEASEEVKKAALGEFEKSFGNKEAKDGCYSLIENVFSIPDLES